MYGYFSALAFPFVWGWIRKTAGPDWKGALAAAAVAVVLAATLADTGLVVTLAIVLVWLETHHKFRKGVRGRTLFKGFPPPLLSPLLLVFAVLAVHVAAHRTPFCVSRIRMKSPPSSRDSSASIGLSHAQSAMGWPFQIGTKRVEISAAALPVKAGGTIPSPHTFESRGLKQRWVEWGAAARLAGAERIFGAGPGRYQAKIGAHYEAQPETEHGRSGFAKRVARAGGVGGPGGRVCSSRCPYGRSCTRPRAARINNERRRRLGPGSPSEARAWGRLWAGCGRRSCRPGRLRPLGAIAALASSLPARARICARSNAWAYRMRPVLALCAAAILAPTVFEKAVGEKIFLWREAEAAETCTAPMNKINDAEASGGAALAIARGAGAGWRGAGGGAARWNFPVTESGSYTLWARVRWIDGCGNTFFVRVNGGAPLILGNDAVYGKWHWVGVPGIKLQPGDTRIELANREDGVAVDKLLLTNEPDFEPRGAWEAAFSRDLSEEPLVGWMAANPASWRAVSGNEGRGRLSAAGMAGNQTRLTLKDPPPPDFRLECRFALKQQGSRLRILMENSGEEWTGLELGNGSARLVRWQDDKEQTLAETPDPSLGSEGCEVALIVRKGLVSVAAGGRTLLERLDRRITPSAIAMEAAAGQVLLERFDLKPLDDIYWMREFTEGEDGPLKLGEPGWSSLLIRMLMTNGEPMPPIRLNVNETGQEYLEVASQDGRYVARHIAQGRVEEEHAFEKTDAQSSSAKELVIRSVDGELTLRVDGAEAGRAAFGPKAPRQGRIELTPRGLGRLEVKGVTRFYDGFGGCDGNNSASWTAQSGKWRVASAPSEELQDCYAQTAEGRALTLTGEEDWENYDLSLMACGSGMGGMGVVFHYLNDNDYDLIRWAPAGADAPYAGRIEWLRRTGGRDEVLASGQAPASEQWNAVEIRRAGEQARLLVNGSEVLHVTDRPGARGKVGLMTENEPAAFFDNVKVDFD